MEENDLNKEAVLARIGADRMALGLSSIPDKIHGDIEEVKKLNKVIGENNEKIIKFKEREKLLIEKIKALYSFVDNC